MVVTLLIVAASCASLELVKFLCENGAEVEATTDRNESPLYVAALFGRVNVVKYLAEKHQASFERADTVHGFTPVEIASCMSAYDVEHYLLTSGAAPPKRKSCIDFDLVDPFNVIDRKGGLEWSQQMEDDTSFLARRRAFELLGENTLGVPLGLLYLDAL